MIINEFNKQDKYLLQQKEDTFTIAIEIELETRDTEKYSNAISEEKIKNIMLNSVKKYVSYKEKNIEKYIEYAEDILDKLDFGEFSDNDENIEILEDYIENEENDFIKNIYTIIHHDYLVYFISDDIDYLIKKIEKHLPNFYKKWASELKFEFDDTLDRGIEFSPNTYLIGIEKTIDFIEDFYSDFNKQNYWEMTNKTGIHINIGRTFKTNWNPLKGFLMISDVGEASYTFKNMLKRLDSEYTKSLFPMLKKEIGQGTILRKLTLPNIQKIENVLNDYIVEKLKEKDPKKFGFNLTHIKKNNYVEYRYPGGKIDKEILIDKLFYFCYVTYLMTDKNFNRMKYVKKLYKFLTELKNNI